jgi:hypothetical protein
MELKNFVEGVNIIAKYDVDTSAEHDKFYMGPHVRVTDPNDIKRLEELGWRIDEDYWRAFV